MLERFITCFRSNTAAMVVGLVRNDVVLPNSVMLFRECVPPLKQPPLYFHRLASTRYFQTMQWKTLFHEWKTFEADAPLLRRRPSTKVTPSSGRVQRNGGKN